MAHIFGLLSKVSKSLDQGYTVTYMSGQFVGRSFRQHFMLSAQGHWSLITPLVLDFELKQSSLTD